MLHRVMLVLLLGCAAIHSAAALRFAEDAAARLHAYERAEAEDERFLSAQWHALEGELVALQRLAEPPRAASAAVSTLQVAAAPVPTNKASPPAGLPAELVKSMPKDLQAQLAGEEAATAMKGVASKAMLTPMLEMLKGLYQTQKERISKINKQEEKSKARFAEQQKAHDERLARIEASKSKVSEGFYQNETRDENHQFTYWQHCRERNHRQFHNSLKITHATMEKEKGMIAAYEKTIAAPVPTKDGARALAKIAKDVGMPEIVFAQVAPAVTHFCTASLLEVRGALGELSAGH